MDRDRKGSAEMPTMEVGEEEVERKVEKGKR
jgi:hypothetical protein